MAVGLRGYTQMAVDMDGSQTLAWPSGSAAGDLAVLEVTHQRDASGDGDTRPVPSTGWTYHGRRVWSKVVTAADLTAPVTVQATLAGLTVFTGAIKINRTTEQPGVKVLAGGAAYYRGWSGRHGADLDPTANRLGSVVTYPTDKHLHSCWYRTSTTAQYLVLTGYDHHRDYAAFEVVPTSGPAAPTPQLPAPGGYVDAASDVQFVWIHNSATQAGVQDKCKVVFHAVGSGTWYYVKADGTVTVTDTELSQSAQTASIDAGVLTSGQAYEWVVYTSESGLWSAASAVQSFTPVAAPTVDTVTATAAAEDWTPGVAWTRTVGFGSQVAWQLVVTADGTAGPTPAIWDSDVVAGDDLSTVVPAQDWADGTTYTAWVRVQQTGGLWSEWVADDFTIDYTPPTAPTSIAAANQASGPLRVTVEQAAGGDFLHVQSSDDSGTTWTDVVTIEAPGTSEVIDQPLAPYGVSMLWRARILETNADGIDVPSSWRTLGAAVASTDMQGYLVSEDGADYLAVDIVGDDRQTLAQPVSVSYGLGDTAARVDRSPSQGVAGSTTVETWTLAERDAVVAWLSGRDVWWLRWPPERASGTVHVPPTLMALAGPVSWSRLEQLDVSPRLVSWSWVEQ